MQRSAIFGMVLHSNAFQPDVARVSDALALGPWSHPIVASVKFMSPITDVRGKQGVWHLDERAQQRLALALRDSTYRDFTLAIAEPSQQPCLQTPGQQASSMQIPPRAAD